MIDGVTSVSLHGAGATHTLSLALALILFLPPPGALRAQLRAPESAPGGTLEVHTSGDQRIFRIGERIPLLVMFTGSSGQVDMRNYDRSGRLDIETYLVEPHSGWRDPLELYYHSGGSIWGGISATPKSLSSDPIVFPADLNEWVRFDRPGEYRLTVTSRRLLDFARPPNWTAVTSKAVPLTIVEATPEWQAQTLRKAVDVLATTPLISSRPRVNTTGSRRDALKTLRFLGTPEAARELARCVPDEDCVLGLAGSPSRQAALDAINERLKSSAARDTTIDFLMSFLASPDTPAAKR